MSQQKTTLTTTKPCSSALATLIAADIAAGTRVYQYIIVALDSSGNVVVASSAAVKPLGILQNRPKVTGEACEIAVEGTTKLRMNEATNGFMNSIVASASQGRGEVADADGDWSIAENLEEATAQNDVIECLIRRCHAQADES